MVWQYCLLSMGKRRFGAITVDFVFLFFQDLIGKLAHKAATNPFANHGSWSHWVTNVLVHTVRMSMTMIVGVPMRMAMPMRVAMTMTMVVSVIFQHTNTGHLAH